jgi:phosphate transport system permease protein
MDQKIKKPKFPKGRFTHPKVIFAEKFSKVVITLGGFSVIAAILGIVFFILIETLPLIMPPKVYVHATVLADEKKAAVMHIAMDEYQENALLFRADGQVETWKIKVGELKEEYVLKDLGSGISGAQISVDGQWLTLGLKNGRIWRGKTWFQSSFEGSERIQTARITEPKTYTLFEKNTTVNKVASISRGEKLLIAGADTNFKIKTLLLVKERTPFGDGEEKQFKFELNLPEEYKATSLAVGDDAASLLVGTVSGELLIYSVSESGLELKQILPLFENESIVKLSYLLGQQTVIAGGSKGSLKGTFEINQKGIFLWEEVHNFKSMRAGVTAIIPSPRKKTFMVFDEAGKVSYFYLSSQKRIFFF